MPKRSSKARKREDTNEAAFRIIREATEEGDAGKKAEPEKEPEEDERPPKNPNAVALGRLGGKKGGPARAKKLSPERRREIAKKAAEARWKKDSPSE